MKMIVKRQFISRVLIKNHLFDSVNVNFYSLESQLRMTQNILVDVERVAQRQELFVTFQEWALSYRVFPITIQFPNTNYENCSVAQCIQKSTEVTKYKNRKNI